MTTGTEGNDVLVNDTSADVPPFRQEVFALGGDDVITITMPFNNITSSVVEVDGGAGFDVLYLSAADYISGLPDVDSIYADDNRNARGTVSWTNIERFVLTVGAGNGFSGFETLKLGAAQDWITMQGVGNVPLKLSTGGGDDRLILNGMQVGGEIDLGTGNDVADFSGSAPTRNAVFTVQAGIGNDVLTGSGYRDEFYGGGGNDSLDGRGSAPTQSADLLVGGLGNDVYYTHGRETIVEAAGEGFDTIYTSVTYGVAAGVSIEQLGTIEWRNTDPFTLAGNELNNSIIGNNGHNAIYGGGGDDSIRGLGRNDVMDGQAGTDYLIGGLGDDIYYVDGLDKAEELAGEGYDAVYARTSYTLNTSSEVEMLATADYASTTKISLSGNQLNNYIVGNNGANIIDGRAGQDSMLGLAGNDLLIGGADVDYMIGGTGNDNYYADTGDTVDELAGEGFDSVYAGASYALTAGSFVELLGTLDYQSTAPLDLTGNEHGQSIVGGYGENALSGLGGADSINGIAGDDRLDGGAGQDYLQGGTGADTFLFTAAGHSAVGAADTIADFVSGSDRIDLSAIDADTSNPGEDAFTLIGATAFSGQAGELRVDGSGGAWQVYGDTNGDSVADLHIAVFGSAPVAGDFAL